MQSVRGD